LQIRRFLARGISANARKLYYNLWDAGKFPSGNNPYKALDNFLVEERLKGHIPSGVLKDVGRETEEDYLIFYPRDDWLPNYCELWIEKEADVDDFRTLVRDLEINVRKAKGFGGWEAACHNFKNIVKMMYKEETQKQVYIFYFGDMDPSGDDMGRHLREQVEHFKNYDFGYGKYRLGEAKVIRLGITQEQIAEHKIALKPDKAIFDKLFGTSVEAGDNRDKPGDSRTSAFIRKYQCLMSSGDRLPPLAELAALFANDRLIDFTRNLIRHNLEKLFNQKLYEALHAHEAPSEEDILQDGDGVLANVTLTLEKDKKYMQQELERRVKFSDDGLASG